MRSTTLETAALLLFMALPPAERTLVKPSDAFEGACDMFSLAFVAVEDAALVASEVVEALREGACRIASLDGRSTARAAVADILWF